jgi:general L-amino acid transport system permease protein
MAVADVAEPASGISWLYNPKVRSFVFQSILLIAVVLLGGWFVRNTAENLAELHIASGFGFLSNRAGFNVQTFLPFTPDDTYGYSLLAGFVDTMVVSVLGIVIATVVGVLVGIARLSSNLLVRWLGTVYVETFRNIPPLLVILFWYFAVIQALPEPRNALDFGLHISLSNRGFFMPRPIFGSAFVWTLAAFVIGLLGAWLIGRWARARQMRTGETFPSFRAGLAFLVVLTLAVFLVTGSPLSFDVPVKTRFNLNGGMTITPEFASLLFALGLYTASFIAEIVRAGIIGVPKGQTEAYSALGLRSGLGLRLVIIPQAMRIIIPPLTSQYLNLTKNSSLAVAIGYPDLYAIGGTILNQTGQAIEVVVVFMVVYLGISVLTSLLMNWFNTKMALKER